MKDFLEGRTAATSARPRSKIADTPSTLPPLASLQEVSISEEPPAMDSPLADPLEQALPEPQAEPLAPTPEPHVELVHDDQGRISHIVVTCRCGEKTTLQCSY